MLENYPQRKTENNGFDLTPTPIEANTNGNPSEEYEVYPDVSHRKELVEICNKIVEYLHDNQIHNLVLLDRSARPAYIGVLVLWRKKYPQVRLPNIYFLNPTGFIDKFMATEESSTGIPRILEIVFKADKHGEDLGHLEDLLNWTPEKVKDRFSTSYPKLIKDKGQPLLIYDNCIHEGSTYEPVKKLLTQLGFVNLKFGVAANSYNYSGIKPDLVCLNRDPIGTCYPFHKDHMVDKQVAQVTSLPTHNTERKKVDRQKRHELFRIFMEAPADWYQTHDSGSHNNSEPWNPPERNANIGFTSIATHKLEQRKKKGVAANVLVLDLDGVIYVGGRSGNFVGENRRTAQSIKDKQLPVIVNTARPNWGNHMDGELETQLSFLKPDVVSYALGTNILWRQPDGSLTLDKNYSRRMGEQRIRLRFENRELEMQYSPELLLNFLWPIFQHYPNIVDAVVENSEIDGAIGTIRLSVGNIDHKSLDNLINNIRSWTRGIKVVRSEHTYTNQTQFTGWIHIVPALAGKDRATRYILDQLARTTNQKIIGHVLGDSSADISMLAAGTNESDNYRLEQWPVANTTRRAKELLERVARNAWLRPSGSKRAHIEFVPAAGPDLIREIVQQLQ